MNFLSQDPIGRLRRALAEAFSQRQANEAARTKPSKRKPLGVAETGPDAAAKYRLRHPLAAGKLRQAMRAARIEAGLRPLKFDVPGKRERKLMSKLAQH